MNEHRKNLDQLVKGKENTKYYNSIKAPLCALRSPAILVHPPALYKKIFRVNCNGTKQFGKAKSQPLKIQPCELIAKIFDQPVVIVYRSILKLH